MDRLHATSLGDILREHRRSYPGKTAVVCGPARYRYPELDERVNRLARALSAAGFEADDRILWLGQNCHRLLESLLAAAKLGGILCPANWRQSAQELAFVLDDVRPKVVLWQAEELGDTLTEARSMAGSNAHWVQHDGAGEGGYEALLAGAPTGDPDIEVDPSSAVLLLYTAAFGGRPKGALLSHTALAMQGLVTSKIKDIGSDYIYLNCGPLFHAATLMSTAATFLWAGTNVFVPRSDPEEICRLIERERCSGAFLVGPTIERMVEVNRTGKYNLKSLRALPATPEWNQMVTLDASPGGQRPGGYGQTECAGLLTIGALGGRPAPLAQVRVVDPEGKELAPGEVGEILARGPILMNGYHNRADEDRARLDSAGWHHTGDLGRREADGSLTFIGPRARLIKSAYENIYPAEVEACIKSHPAVADCAVIGIPDPKWNQSVKAIVALRTGQMATADEIVEHCRSRIASYKKPRSVEFVDRLPRKAGLLDYDALDARFGGGGYPGR